MKRKGYFKRKTAGILAFALGISAILPGVTLQASKQGEIELNPEIRYQTLKGWGTSLCWWGNTIGAWGNQDFNGDGRADRDEIAELAFSPDYLNLNIARYNVGGGDKEDSSIKRCEGLVPGWTEDMTGTKDGSSAFQADAFYGKTTEEMADAGQLWMLEQANAYRAVEGDIINEVFANSPPYYMTKSGSSTGGYSWDLNNLKDDQYAEFTQYLARATKWIDQKLGEKYETSVTYIEPLNEPDTSYWQDGSTKQEGCIFNAGELQSRAYREMAVALDNEGLSHIQTTGTDETSLDKAIHSFWRMEDDVKERMTTIGAHTYGGNDQERKELRQMAAQYDKDLWMSEVTKGGGSHYDGCHESMDAGNTRSQSEGIMSDLKQMQSSAWIAWLVADSEYECLQTNSNWGLLHAVFEKDGPVPDYHTNLVNGDGSKQEWVPEEGYWAVTKQFYTMMQYSKYLKAGYHMIEIGDGNMCAAISPDGTEVVIVAQNFGDERNTTIDLSRVPGAVSAEVYRTSDTESCVQIEEQDVSGGTLSMNMPYNSVTTYVIRSEAGSALCNMENSSKIIDAGIVKPDAGWTSEMDKFTYEGSWGDSAEEFGGGKYSTEEYASATFTFEGDQAAIYGSKAPDGAMVRVTVDGADMGEVSLETETKDGNVMLFDTGKLADGVHRITISKVEGQGNKLVELNYGRVISGDFTEEVLRIEESEEIYTISGTTPEFPETVSVITNKDKREDRPVTWNLAGIDFTEDVTVYGTLEGTTEEAYVNVRVIEKNLQYFVDCNSLNSPIYQKINECAKLLNETADQAYKKDSWGYRNTYGKYEGEVSDAYDTGWYAQSGQAIEYTFPLKAGTYQVSLGFKEWWKDSHASRPMKIVMSQGGVQKELGTSDTWEGGNWWNKDTYTITCETDGDVTLSAGKAGDTDPVLSFIEIQKTSEEEEEVKVDRSSLELAVTMADKMEKQQTKEQCYTKESWGAVEAALSHAREVLKSAEPTQAEVDSAFLDLITACNLVENGLQKTGLGAAIEGTKAILADEKSLAAYTKESVQKVREALVEAQQMYDMADNNQNDINAATNKLLTAVTALLVEEAETRLGILIKSAEMLLKNEGIYTASSVQLLKAALEDAKKVNEDSQASEAQMKEAYEKLAKAMTSLVRKANKEELKNALDKADEILTQSGKYLKSSISGLQAVTDQAKAIYENQDADEGTVGEILKKLIQEILKARLLGDADLNGEVDTKDAVKLLRASAELEILSEEQAAVADVNQNGAADINDAVSILRYAAEKIKDFN